MSDSQAPGDPHAPGGADAPTAEHVVGHRAAVERAIIDAHAHVWNRARTPIDWIDESLPEIDRDFSVPELETVAQDAATALGARIDGFVLVQALNDAGETADLLAAAHGPVVGWLDLDAPDAPGRLDVLRGQPGGERLVGIRHLAHVDPDPEWLLRPTVAHGLDALAAAGLSFDLVVRPWQLATAARVADAHPELQFVLDHLGQPPATAAPDAATSADPATSAEPGDAAEAGPALTAIAGSAENGEAAFARWAADLAELARRPNVVAKVSGVAVRGGPASVARLDRVAGVALEAFGPGRLMFGSDWPLVRLADDYRPWLAQYLAWSSALSSHERQAIDADTARSAYTPTRVPRALASAPGAAAASAEGTLR
ncbi:amidohydrolase family protein [Herbiconiux sp.]|uniref:amidohydrolase family protein n=1 Tax=Herbiconiux sp. TaxID=1871186 RepID=UPI0025C3C59C|nr:amidohydrolase family protein [Herbiconiux sp.]